MNMYKVCTGQWEDIIEEDSESLSSSFWTDQESEEEQRECFDKEYCGSRRIEKNKQENEEGKGGLMKADGVTGGEHEKSLNEDVEEPCKDEGTEKMPGGEAESEGECFMTDSTERNSEDESEEDEEERECFVRGSSGSKPGSGDSDSEVSESEEQESGEENGSLVTVERLEKCEIYNTVKEERENLSHLRFSSCAEDETRSEEHLHEEENVSEQYEATGLRSVDHSGDEKSEGHQMECFVTRRVEESGSDEDVEYFVSDADKGVVTKKEPECAKEERCTFFGNQDGVESFAGTEAGVGVGPEETSVKHREDEGGCFLNEYNTYISAELNRYEQTCRPNMEEDQNETVQQMHSNDLRDSWVNIDDADGSEWTDQSCIKQGQRKNELKFPELKWKHSVDHENEPKKDDEDLYGETEDYFGSVGSPTASILTSGYGTYRPDSPKDDLDGLDYRDEEDNSILTGQTDDTEYPNTAYRKDKSSPLTDQPRVSLEASEQEIPFDCEDNIQPNIDLSNQKRLGSHSVSTENEQKLHIAAESIERPSREELNSISSQIIKEGNLITAYGSGDLVMDTMKGDYRHPFNLKLSKSVTVVEHRSDGEHVRWEMKKTNVFRHESVSELEERMDQLRVSAPRGQHLLVSESEETGSYTDRHSSATEELPSAFQAYIKGMTRSHSEGDIRPRPKSFIRPVDHPHTSNLKKMDPVARYFQYKQDWEMFKPPGEKSRKELRWAIKEQLAYQPPPKPQRTYVPNTYVVPTEKKRSALRWEIRHDLAYGIIPTKISYP